MSANEPVRITVALRRLGIDCPPRTFRRMVDAHERRTRTSITVRVGRWRYITPAAVRRAFPELLGPVDHERERVERISRIATDVADAVRDSREKSEHADRRVDRLAAAVGDLTRRVMRLESERTCAHRPSTPRNGHRPA